MRKLLFISVMIWCGFTAAAQDQFIVDANAQLRKLNGSFSKIKISHAFKVVITQADTESLAVSSNDEKYMDDIITELEGSTLNIRSKNNSWTGKRNRQLKVYISFKKLEAIEISGASDVIGIGTIKQSSVKVEVSGASSLKGQFETGTLSVDLSGASQVNLKGSTEVLKAECSGASDMNAYDLTAELADLDVSGASDIEINVNKEIKAEASGAS
ncbi:MAG: DUF2807 domain-containing protein, partial [Sphingobacteriales bacterium]